ncbi:histidine kinase [Providencia stuartii]|uniref:tail fiber protein n=1 Tax=Providencia stuartii TaxID=588 RepID=UPI0012B51177|nr:tail fiber protein [Providencia stuartii]MTC68034.1 histidine kinase [Providencia stuartii]
MSVIKKPDLKIFAQDAKTGEIETFPDVLRGWGITLDRTAGKPPLEWFNAIGKRVDEWLMYLTQRGVAEWDTTLSYPKAAIVQWNGVIYVSNKETKGEQPDKSQAAWSTLGVFLGLGNYYTKTDTDTKFQLKGNYALKGESYTKVESDTRFQPKGNYLPSGYSYSKSESDTKYQPKGNYAPAGDYATNTALKNGLNGKLNSLMPVATGALRVVSEGDYAGANFERADGYRLTLETLPESYASFGILHYKDKSGKLINSIYIPKKSGNMMLDSDGYVPKGWSNYHGFMKCGRMEARVGKGGANVNIADDFPVGVTAGITTFKDYGIGSSVYDYGALITARGWQDPTGASAQAQLLVTNVGICGRTAYKNGDNKSQFHPVAWKAFTDKNTTKDHNGNLKVSGSSSELSDYPVGAPIPWPQATAPTGYLICNGQAFNKTTYPLLAKAYPSGKLPDLRGEFIRGLDAGRNIDSGRAVLSSQSDAIRDITGDIQGLNLGGSGVFSDRKTIAYAMSPNGSGKDQQNLKFKASNVVPTANENRPRNIAFLYIVRAA